MLLLACRPRAALVRGLSLDGNLGNSSRRFKARSGGVRPIWAKSSRGEGELGQDLLVRNGFALVEGSAGGSNLSAFFSTDRFTVHASLSLGAIGSVITFISRMTAETRLSATR